MANWRSHTAADAWRRLRKNKLAMAGLVWIIFIILIAVTADLWAPRFFGDPVAHRHHDCGAAVASAPLRRASVRHRQTRPRHRLPVPYTGLGSRLLVGVWPSRSWSIVGLILGAIAAYYGGLWDSIVMRTADVFFAFPYILFAITLIAVLGQGACRTSSLP